MFIFVSPSRMSIFDFSFVWSFLFYPSLFLSLFHLSQAKRPGPSSTTSTLLGASQQASVAVQRLYTADDLYEACAALPRSKCVGMRGGGDKPHVALCMI